MPKELGNEQFPQDKIDLAYWQYMSGVVDAINQDPSFLKINEERIITLKKRRLARIAEHFNDRQPTFDLKLHLDDKNVFTLIKI